MNSFDTYTGVCVAQMSWTLRAGLAVAAAAKAPAGVRAAHRVIPQPKRRNAAATVASVNRGTT